VKALELSQLLGVLATIAGILMSVGYIPQAVKIVRRKSVKDISLISFLVVFFGVIVWLAYGISISDLPLIITNAIGAITIGIIVLLYVKYRDFE
jgi:MtN3 and saliva related transmembrane protein